MGEEERERGKNIRVKREVGGAHIRLENGKIKRSLIAAVLDAVMFANEVKLSVATRSGAKLCSPQLQTSSSKGLPSKCRAHFPLSNHILTFSLALLFPEIFIKIHTTFSLSTLISTYLEILHHSKLYQIITHHLYFVFDIHSFYILLILTLPTSLSHIYNSI